MTRAEFKTYLGDKAFYQNVAKIAIPISLQSLITIGVNMMDTIKMCIRDRCSRNTHHTALMI